MKKNKEKGFTLIELISVLVIMAIIALIVTPLVMSIIRKARVSADKRSIDAYGRSIELAIAGYLLDNGSFPTSIGELTIEYSGDTVICETTQINPDSSVYLSNCKVNNREVTNYTYGNDSTPSYEAYSVGDEVTYNGVDYYVLKDSGAKDNVVTLLKAEPLSYEEIQVYSVGTGAENSYQNDYGTMFFYKSDGCQHGHFDDCVNSYADSKIKIIVDAWTDENIVAGLKTARLITYEELMPKIEQLCPGYRPCFDATLVKYDWMYDENYSYWTMTPAGDYSIYKVSTDGQISTNSTDNEEMVRPVVELYKNDGITRKN